MRVTKPLEFVADLGSLKPAGQEEFVKFNPEVSALRQLVETLPSDLCSQFFHFGPSRLMLL
jgi:hypothetical protein